MGRLELFGPVLLVVRPRCTQVVQEHLALTLEWAKSEYLRFFMNFEYELVEFGWLSQDL